MLFPSQNDLIVVIGNEEDTNVEVGKASSFETFLDRMNRSKASENFLSVFMFWWSTGKSFYGWESAYGV